MSVLAASVLDVTVVLALAFLALAALRWRSAALRHAVLASVLLASALAPVLEMLGPTLPLIPWGGSTATSGLTLTSGDPVAGSGTIAAAAGDATGVPWTIVLLGGWLAGALTALAGLLTGVVRLARLTARCSPVTSGRWREIADDLSHALGLQRPVAILQSADRALLVTCGVLRPAIILPAGATAWSDERLRIVLAHELAHVRRGDGATQLAGEALRVIHWFNPLVWLACRRLREESEYACDDAVLSGGVEATDYAAHLLDVARHAVGRHRTWASASAIAHPSTLERRVAAMLNDQRNRQPSTRRTWAAAIVGALAIVVPLAAAGIAPAADPSAVSHAADVMLAPAADAPAPVASATRRPASSAAFALVRAAQDPASVSGTLIDPTGAVLPGVQLTLTEVQSNTVYTATSDGTGRFVFRDLPPAQYELVARLPGFRPVTNVMSLPAGSSAGRVITLPLGTVQERITAVCSGTAAAASRPSQLAGGAPVPDSRGTHARLGHVWDRALRTMFPILSAQQDRPVPVRVGGNVKAPLKLTDARPRCPIGMVPAPGTIVRLTGRIGVDGFLNDLSVAPPAPGTEPPAEFTDSALDAARQWTFTPTLLNGEPVEATLLISFEFRPM